MFDLKYLDLYDTITKDEMLCKLYEEVKEVEFEMVVPVTTKEKLAEELLDVMQVCLGIAYTYEIDLEKYVTQHKVKLLSRGHKFKEAKKKRLNVFLDDTYEYSDDYN